MMVDTWSVPLIDSERRNAQRADVRISATKRKSGEKPEAVMICDLSATGCRAESLARLHVGDRIWITLAGFSAIEGVVRWRTPRGFGCEWNAPLHDAVYAHICSAYPLLSRHATKW